MVSTSARNIYMTCSSVDFLCIMKGSEHSFDLSLSPGLSIA